MNRVDYYTGEPTIGSPNLTLNTSEERVNSMPNNGDYTYDVKQRSTNIPTSYGTMPQQQPVQQFNIGYNQQPSIMNNYGYNPQMQQPMGGFYMNQPQQPSIMNNYGYNPQMQQSMMNYGYPNYNPYQQPVYGYQGQPYMQQQPYMIQQPMMMGGYNPAFFQPRYEDQVVHVPGLNNNEVMIKDDLEEKCNELQMQMMVDEQKAIEVRQKRMQGFFNYNYGNNYYGAPFMQQWADQSVVAKYRRIAEDLRNEALERRSNFNKNLSRLAHNFSGSPVDDNELDKIYDGYSYIIPANMQRNMYDQSRFTRMVPVQPFNPYIENYNQIKKAYNLMVDPHGNMQDFLRQLGVVQIAYNLEEDMHRRRDDSRLYNRSSYTRFLANACKSVQSSTLSETGHTANIDLTNANINNNNTGMVQESVVMNDPNRVVRTSTGETLEEARARLKEFPVLSEAATILDDGTMQITAPDWMGDGMHHVTPPASITAELESKYENNRSKFLQSIYNQTGR